MTAVALFSVAPFAQANPVDGVYFDLPGCDDHGMQQAFEELGTGPFFPADELIAADSFLTGDSACPPMDNGIASSLVTITNLTNGLWENLYYVADPQTTFTNVDGRALSFANAAVETIAFRIDAVGVNRPLVFESMTPDGIFEPGETWQFIVQNFTNAFGLPASSLGSLDFSGASDMDSLSAASIIQMRPVPTPGALTLLAMSGMVAARRRRS